MNCEEGSDGMSDSADNGGEPEEQEPEVRKKFPRPNGRAPTGKAWDENTGKWVIAGGVQGENPFMITKERTAQHKVQRAAVFSSPAQPDPRPLTGHAARAAANIAGPDSSLADMAALAEAFAAMMDDQMKVLTSGLTNLLDQKQNQMLRLYQAQAQEIAARVAKQTKEAEAMTARLEAAANEAKAQLDAAAELRPLQDYSWLAMQADATAFCVVCSEHFRSLADGRMRREACTFIRSKGGADMNAATFRRNVKVRCHSGERQRTREGAGGKKKHKRREKLLT